MITAGDFSSKNSEILKIRQACNAFMGFLDFLIGFHQMVKKAVTGSNFDLVRAMKTIVPEFKSQNSVYEQLDQ